VLAAPLPNLTITGHMNSVLYSAVINALNIMSRPARLRFDLVF
jgi:hypothetical protein